MAGHRRCMAALAALGMAIAVTPINGAAFYVWSSHCVPNTDQVSLPPTGAGCVGAPGTTTVQPTFAISPSPTYVVVAPGHSGTSTLSILPWDGFSGTVTMAVGLAPDSPVSTTVTMATFGNGLPETQVSPDGRGNYPPQVVTFNVPADATVGGYRYTIQAESATANPPYVSGSLWLRVTNVNNASPNDGASCPDPNCSFSNGGTIISNPQVYVILWGSLFDSDPVDQLPVSLMATSGDLPGSQYASRLSQYGVSGFGGGATWIDSGNDSNLKNPLTDQDLEGEIDRANVVTGWGAGTGNHIYVVVPEVGYAIENTIATGTKACAYHDWNPNGDYAYIALPDFDNGNYMAGCVTDRTASPQNSDEEVMTHEIVEVATDPQNGTGWTDGVQELADVCNWDSTLLAGQRYATGSEFYDKGAGQCMGQQERGYWTVNNAGTVFPFGDATYHGQVSGALNRPISGIAAHPSGSGYWLVGQDGGVFSYGSSPFLGSLPGQGISPAAPIVGIASTPDGNGYWLVGTDGGVFTYGNAPFLGSMAGHQLDAPVAGIAPTPDGEGYWLVSQDGGVFAFGDALYDGNDVGNTFGSCAGVGSEQWLGIGSSPEGLGYWNFANTSDVSPHQDTSPGVQGDPAPFFGSTVCDSTVVQPEAAFNFDRWGALSIDTQGSTYQAGDIPGPTGGSSGGPFVGLAFTR